VAFQAFHGDERAPGVFTYVVNRANVGMIESRRRFRLAFKPFECLPVMRQFLRQEFQRHGSFQARILGLIHHTHPPAAQLLEDAVMRERLADKR
jgi:hypothetical protein